MAARRLMMMLSFVSVRFRKQIRLLAVFTADVNAPAYRAAFSKKGSGLLNMNKLRSLPLFVMASALLCTAAPWHSKPTRRPHRFPIDESNLVTLKGNTPPAANAEE